MRRTTKNNSARIVTIFLCIAIIAAAAWAATSEQAGNYISEKILAPMFSTKDKTTATAISPSSTISPTENPVQNSITVTQTLDYPAFNIYAVQLGAYTTKVNAAKASNVVQDRGGSGYILEQDGFYRVLAAAFYSDIDASRVKDNLISQGYDAFVKGITIDGVSLNITAEADQIADLKSAHDIWIKSAEKLYDLGIAFDEATITRSQLNEELLNQTILIDDVIESLSDKSETNSIIGNLNNQLILCKNALNSLSNPVFSDIEVSSQLKYLMIDFIYRFGEYSKSIS